MHRRNLHATVTAAAIATTLMAASPAIAIARTTPGDATATREYLQLDLKQTRAEVKAFPAALAAIGTLREHLQAECPGVLAGESTPAAGEKPSSSAVAIAEEVDGAVFGAAEHTESQLRRGFAHAVSRLAWSDGSLTRLVHSFAAAELAQSQLAAPDLCADLRSWVASGRQTVSAATEAYVHRQSTLAGETEAGGETIMRRLVRDGDENEADKSTAREISKLEKHSLQTAAPQVIAAIGKVGEVLHDPAP
jgi:hypothetical protein